MHTSLSVYTSSQQTYRIDSCVPTNQLVGCSSVQEPVDAFLLFISDKMVKSMVKFTNLEGKRNKADFVETDDIEMRAFVGCILFLGGMKQNMLSSTTVFDAMYGQGFVLASFSRNRFLQLLNFLRFDDKETRSARRSRDVFASFRDFWDAFTRNLSDHYIPGPFITIDEQLVPFRGRCSFIQYLPSKPDKDGIKIFWAADAENNFPLVAEPCLGRPLGADRQVNVGRNVALRLSAPFFDSGRNVTTDNFFTDKELSDVLQNNGLTFVGTVRANKRFLPESFKNKRGLQLHASSFLFQDKTTIVNYQTKRNKNVVAMSTMHHDCAVAPQAPKKPDIIRFYNSTKGAVDSVDQMAHAYSTKHITRRWPMVLFYNTLDLSTIAARIVWSIKFPDHLLSKKDARPQFILRVAEQLSLEHMERRLCAQNMPKFLKNTMEMHVQHLQQKAATSLDERQIARAGGKRKRPASAQRPSTSKQISQKKPNKNQGRCGSCS